MRAGQDLEHSPAVQRLGGGTSHILLKIVFPTGGALLLRSGKEGLRGYAAALGMTISLRAGRSFGTRCLASDSSPSTAFGRCAASLRSA